MCGVAGAIGALTPDIARAVQRMNEAQRHRGPDDEGAWQEVHSQTHHGAAFAFRRLSIIDLSPDGHQPMIDPDTGNVIIFNGEIYNHHELRDGLRREGARFRSKSDTEVILKIYARDGAKCINQLRGMFAFALWDARQRTVMLARDRVGIKPLYLCTVDQPSDCQTILFASEVRGLLASGLVQRRLNRTALSSYVWNGFVPGPETIVEGVRLLPAGTFAIVHADDARCELHRYWELPRARSNGSLAIEELRHQLSVTARQHLGSDVPLGVFLSGGVDSSALAALAVKSSSAPVRTFNIGFDEARFDESHYARTIAGALGTEHSEIRLSQSLFRAQLHDALNSLDQPTFDAINTYFISRAVREAGITVALAGTGGDELFGGYRSFVDLPRAVRWTRRARLMPRRFLQPIGAAVARVHLGRFGEAPPQTRWGKLADGLATRGKLLDLYQTAYSLFTINFQNQLLAEGIDANTHSGLPSAFAARLSEIVNGDCSLHAVSTLELSCFIGERLLRDTDAASMAVSLEARVPLLDHHVIESVAAVDESARFHPLGRKMLLRELALKDLNSQLFDRPKSGFELPFALWCKQELSGEIDSAFSDHALCESIGLNQDAVLRLWRAFKSGAPGIYWSRIWALFVILWWCKTHRVALA